MNLCFNVGMALTKTDLRAIRTIVKGEINPLKKDIKKIDKKFDKLFNFLDKEWSKLSRRVDIHDKYSNVDTKEMVSP